MNYKERVKSFTTLRECPFCGAPAYVRSDNEITCTECPAMMHNYLHPGSPNNSLEPMVALGKLWNTRNKESAAATLMGIKELARVKK